MRLLERIRLRRKYGIGLLAVLAKARQLKEAGADLAADQATAETILELLVADSPQTFAGPDLAINWAALIELILELLPLILALFGL